MVSCGIGVPIHNRIALVQVKIQEDGYNAALDPPWASKRLPTVNRCVICEDDDSVSVDHLLAAPGRRRSPLPFAQESISSATKSLAFNAQRRWAGLSFTCVVIVQLGRASVLMRSFAIKPACHQITVTGSGTKALPAGIALPGGYTLDDPGILLQYREISATLPYTPPGMSFQWF